MEYTFKPEILKPEKPSDFLRIKALMQTLKSTEILDLFSVQQRELIKISNPSRLLKESDITDIQQDLNKAKDARIFGSWVFYPWKNTLVHLLNESDFIKLRTSRNQYKITPQEQRILSKKRVGIIGLSVGHSVAMNLAVERSVGELRLADFDTLELSNLNRVRSSIFNIGLPKVVIAARDIVEIDPFLKVSCFHDGITEDNIDAFFTENGKLDFLVEECDGLHIKILSRLKAREYGIPVIMETSDRGMVDVERFDIEPERPILHGLIEHLDLTIAKNLKTSEEKIPYLMPMVGIDTASVRLKASALEVGQSISTWPQLASSVMLGSAILSDTYRRIVLGQFNESGRYVLDPQEILKDKVAKGAVKFKEARVRGSLSKSAMLQVVKGSTINSSYRLSQRELQKIVHAISKAPSGGNSQPWKCLYAESGLFLFLDKSCSDSFMDYRYSASYIALGSALENARIMAASIGLAIDEKIFPIPGNKEVVALMNFRQVNRSEEEMALQIDLRYTDRSINENGRLTNRQLTDLNNISSQFKTLQTYFIDSKSSIDNIAYVVSSGDWMRVMHPRSHYDFTREEMRWTREELVKERNGICVDELNLTAADLAGLHLVRDDRVIDFMNEYQLGRGLKHIYTKIIKSTPLIVAIYSKAWDEGNFLEAGRLMERLWLYCTKEGIGFQVINVPLAFLLRIKHHDVSELSPELLDELKGMKRRMEEVIPDYSEKTDIMLIRLFKSPGQKPTSLRREVNQILEVE